MRRLRPLHTLKLVLGKISLLCRLPWATKLCLHNPASTPSLQHLRSNERHLYLPPPSPPAPLLPHLPYPGPGYLSFPVPSQGHQRYLCAGRRLRQVLLPGVWLQLGLRALPRGLLFRRRVLHRALPKPAVAVAVAALPCALSWCRSSRRARTNTPSARTRQLRDVRDSGLRDFGKVGQSVGV